MALEGPYDFTATPGTQVIIHEKSIQHKTWAPHGKDGWYIGPAPEHYRCYRTYVTTTKSEWISDTVTFLHHNTKIPTVNPIDEVITAVNKLTKVLVHPPDNTPITKCPNDTITALKTLAKLFGTTLKQHSEASIQQQMKPQDGTTSLRVIQDRLRVPESHPTRPRVIVPVARTQEPKTDPPQNRYPNTSMTT